MKASSDRKIYTTMTVNGSGSDPSPPEPGVFALVYATEVKEVAHWGPNVESHMDTTGMYIVDLPQKSLVKESIKFNS